MLNLGAAPYCIGRRSKRRTVPSMTRGLSAVLAVLLLAGCGGAAKATGGTSPAPVASPFGSTLAQSQSWPVQWCKAQPGMTRDQLRALMGPPSDEAPLSSGNPQMSWSFGDYLFMAFMDNGGRVRSLSVDAIMMTRAEKASVHCALERQAP